MQCILPPHMLDSMKVRGDASIKKMAATIEKEAAAVRTEREAAVSPNAFLGTPVRALDAGNASVNRKVYDGQGKATLPGKLVRAEGDPPVTDEIVNVVYDLTGLVYDLFLQKFDRDSLDGQGLVLESTVHHRRSYNNAFWNGTQMAYGDGDGRLFKTFTELSVIGHELSHGVVQFAGGLVYRDQSGALNESFADVFGALVVQHSKNQTAAEANWLIGEGILGPDINGSALRSMKAPGTAYNDPILGIDPQPYHMDLYVNTSSDNGGVHINSGIPNHAFYLLAQYLGGFAWEKAGKIWHEALQRIQNPMATFADWADMTVDVARDWFGNGSLEMMYTRRAWKLVGINV
jgi:Zn-dependent metalloprotease